MSWLNNPPASDDAGDEPTLQTSSTSASTKELSLHALRALGIFFIRGAVAALVGFSVGGVGFAIFSAGAAGSDRGAMVFGGVLMAIGAVVGVGWQIVVLVAASDELRKSGV